MLIIGHRGCDIEPENTLRALKKGMECADFVEVDGFASDDPCFARRVGIKIKGLILGNV
jgi:hypothetical protein